MKVTLFVLLLATMVTPASAQFWSGNKLYEACSDSAAGHVGTCNGFVIAAVDADLVNDQPKICIPRGTTLGQLVDMVTKFLGAYPEHRHKSAVSIVQSLMRVHFPCP